MWGAGVVAVLVFGLSGRAGDFDPAGLTSPFGATGDVLVAPFARWDSVWYLAIAGGGYGGGAREAFFPLYPLVVRLAGLPLGSPLIGGILASTALLSRRARAAAPARRAGLRRARSRATPCSSTALFPMSFFFSAVYSESLFLALSVGAIYAARRDRWALAGALGALAAATRSAGVLLLVPLLILYLWDTRVAARRDRDALRPTCCGSRSCRSGWPRTALYLELAGLRCDGAVSCAGGLVSLVRRARSSVPGTASSPACRARASCCRAAASRSSSRPPAAIRSSSRATTSSCSSWLVLIVAAVVGVLRRLPAAYGAYLVAALALPLSYPVAPQPLMSLPRFVAVLFPLAIWLALWMTGRVWRERLVLAAFALGLADLHRDLRDVALGRVPSRSTRWARSSSCWRPRRCSSRSSARAASRSPSARPAAALAEEIAFYRANHDMAPRRRVARAACASAARRCCARRCARAGADVGSLAQDELREALLAALRFRAYPEVPEALRALRAAGHRLVVVSNWDVSLHDALRTTGLAALVDAAISSAEAGVAKPDPRIFARALELVGGRTAGALHAGDSLENDVAGALAAGLRPVLVARGERPAGVGAGVAVIGSLGELVALAA